MAPFKDSNRHKDHLPVRAPAPKRLRTVNPCFETGLTPVRCDQYASSHEAAIAGRDIEIVPKTAPSLTSLPDDVISKIMSYLPHLPLMTTSQHLQEAYVHLSLARSFPPFAPLSRIQANQVTGIDPFPDIPHVEPQAHFPPYAQPKFLAFLVPLCANLNTLRAPCVKGVLQFTGYRLRNLAFIDTGLTLADLRFLKDSSLTCATITSPSLPVLRALADAKTLRHLKLLRVHEGTIPSIIALLSRRTVRYFFIDINSESDTPLLSLLHGLPPLQLFVVNCKMHQVWWALRYLRRIAVKVERVEIIVGGIRIRVKKFDESAVDSIPWETSIMRRLVCREDIEGNELNCRWPEEMSITEIDLEAYERASDRGVRRRDIDRLLGNCFGLFGERFFEEITVRFGRTIPSMVQAELRARRLSGFGVGELVNRLVISQDVVLYARNDCEHWSYKFLLRLLDGFSSISAMQICASSKGRKVSGRFIMALPNFLRAAVMCCPNLQCVYLEDAGELVLQTIGLSVLTVQSKLRELIRSVIASIKRIEVDEEVELGTVVAQLEIWAGQQLKVANERL